MSDEAVTVTFELDGRAVEHSALPKRTALDVFREDLDLKQLKPGCSPQGVCGCCAVEVGGQLRLTCTLPFKSLAGKSVKTSVPAEVDERLAGVAEGSCGYCLPGMAASAHLLLQKSPEPTEEEVDRALQLHACRCTGWQPIRDAIRGVGAAAGERGREIVSGRRATLADWERPGMVHAALVIVPAGQRLVRVEGDMLATGAETGAVGVVVGPTRAASRRLRDAVVVETEPVAPPTGAVLRRVVAARGEGKGARRASVTLRFSPMEHGFLEPECALAVPAGERVVLYTNGEDARLEAEAAGPGVDVELVSTGGGFGGRRAPLAGPLAVLAARALGRPVKLSLTLEEGAQLHGVRPGGELTLEGGAEGERLVDLVVRGRFDLGRGGDASVMDGLVENAPGPFDVQRLDVDVVGVEGAGPRAGGARGALLPHLAAALDTLREALGLAPAGVALRWSEGAFVEVAEVAGELHLAAGLQESESVLEAAAGMPLRWVSSAPASSALPGEALALALEAVAELKAGRRGRSLPREAGALAGRGAVKVEGQVSALVLPGPPDPLAAGAAHEGLAMALVEELPLVEGRGDARLRTWGIPKAGQSPKIRFEGGPPGAFDAEIARLGALVAVLGAVRGAEGGRLREALPLRDAEASYTAGARRPRSA